jgi:hypothetical protein
MLKLTDGWPVLNIDQCLWFARQRLTAFDMALFKRVREEDLGLLNACLALECELRNESFAAAERLLALASGSEGDLDDRLLKLPLPEFAAAAQCLYALGWIDRE